jgi:hypothetical protein
VGYTKVLARGDEMHPGEVQAKIEEAYNTGALIPVCAWCGRMSIEEEWIVPPAGVLTTIDAPMTISHSICPDCSAKYWPGAT